MTVQPVVQVQLLGSFVMSLGEKTAGPWPRTSAKRLVALVLLSPRRRISKEVASDTLFRDLAPRAATNALYNALSAARAVLAGLGGTAAGILCTDRTHIYIPDDAPVEIDLELHESALRAALGMAPGDGRDATLVDVLREERVLLEDEAYSDWVLQRHESLELARQEARLALARDRSAGFGRPGPEAVIFAWEKYAAHDPASEEAAAALMSAFAAQGQRHLVARAYRRCCDALEEVGLKPSVALERAYQTTTQEVALLATSYSADLIEPANNLPRFLSSFVGRKEEQAEVVSLVRSWPLVTVTGAGGSGKTRLAVEVAAQTADERTGGTFFVDLAPVLEPGQVPAALATATGVLEQPGRPLQKVLAEALGGQDLLVVMDNCEHVIGAAAELAEVLQRSCPQLRLLATSRQPLGVGGEHVYRLGPLSLPAEDARSLKDLDGSDAVKLFVERARSDDSTFFLDEPVAGLVGSICRTLDGLPLALELAAARVPGMSLADLDQRLDRRFRLLTGGSRTSLPRQRTLLATFDWSFELLSPAEQVVLMGLSAFSGSFELEAAEAVCSSEAVSAGDVADLVGSLVGKSLVVAQRSSGSLRYSLLETVRQYGVEQLVAAGGEAALGRARSAHGEYYLQLAERSEPMILGADQAHWRKKLGLDWDNLRAALGYFLSQPGRSEEVLRMTSLVFFFWRETYALDAARSALARADPVPDEVRAKALCRVGCQVFYTGFSLVRSEAWSQAGTTMMKEGLEVSRRLGDEGLAAEVLANLSQAAEWTGDRVGAVRYAQEALETGRSLGDHRLIGNALGALGLAVPGRAEKKRLLAQAVAHQRRAGDLSGCSWWLINLAVLELADENSQAAAELLEEDLAICRELDLPVDLTMACRVLADITLFEGRFEEAANWLREALILSRRQGRQDSAVADFPNAVCCVARVGNLDDAARLTGAYNAMLSRHLPLEYSFTAENPGAHLQFLRQTLLEQTVAYMREALGDANFEMLSRAGAKLSYDDAIDLALGVIPTRGIRPGKTASTTRAQPARNG
jgi:predicted ATPase/DNA-binding SARP family transcriptional activator